ncbi:MAG: bacteriohemerythrin [Desulfopila sp.]
METIKWNDSLSVGVQEMNRQHQKLIAMINRLIEEQHTLTEPATIAELIMEMTDYAEEHFRAEEYLMAEYGYDRLRDQEQSHRAFIDKTVEFMEAKVGPNLLSVALLEYLGSWLTNHILHEDMQYKSFFAGKGLI